MQMFKDYVGLVNEGLSAKEEYEFFQSTVLSSLKVLNRTLEEQLKYYIDNEKTQSKKTVKFAQRWLKKLEKENK